MSLSLHLYLIAWLLPKLSVFCSSSKNGPSNQNEEDTVMSNREFSSHSAMTFSSILPMVCSIDPEDEPISQTNGVWTQSKVELIS